MSPRDWRPSAKITSTCHHILKLYTGSRDQRSNLHLGRNGHLTDLSSQPLDLSPLNNLVKKTIDDLYMPGVFLVAKTELIPKILTVMEFALQ